MNPQTLINNAANVLRDVAPQNSPIKTLINYSFGALSVIIFLGGLGGIGLIILSIITSDPDRADNKDRLGSKAQAGIILILVTILWFVSSNLFTLIGKVFGIDISPIINALSN